MALSAPDNGQPCHRFLTSRSCRPGPGQSASSNLLVEHRDALGKVSRPKDLSETRCYDAAISYKELYDILAEPAPRRARPTARMPQTGTVCRLFRARGKCKQGHCIGNCRGACPCAVPGSGANTRGTPPLACPTVRKQLELLSIDQRSAESTIAMTLLRAPAPHDAQTALTALPVTSTSPFFN